LRRFCFDERSWQIIATAQKSPSPRRFNASNSFHLDAMKSASPMPADVQELYDAALRPIQRNFRLWRECMAAMDAAAIGGKFRTARKFGRRLGVRVSTVYNRRADFRKRGPIALLDMRAFPECWHGQHCRSLPAPAVAHLRKIAEEGQFTAQAAVRALASQLRRWQRGDASAAVPGYALAPKGKTPPGWSPRNLSRLLAFLPKRPVTFKIVILVRSNGTVLSVKASKLK
jgi:hypothetical protein